MELKKKIIALCSMLRKKSYILKKKWLYLYAFSKIEKKNDIN